MPSIAYGHIYWDDQDTILPDIATAIDVGFRHLDTAQGKSNQISSPLSRGVVVSVYVLVLSDWTGL